jgi:hypothetical protein
MPATSRRPRRRPAMFGNRRSKLLDMLIYLEYKLA